MLFPNNSSTKLDQNNLENKATWNERKINKLDNRSK